MRIAVKEVGKELSIVETSEKYRTDCVKAYTGKNESAEFILMTEDGTLCMGVNENGLMLELETNFLMHLNNPHFPYQKIVGPVVFTRHKYVDVFKQEIWDYELEDLTDEDIERIRYILGEEYQAEVAKKFVDYESAFPMRYMFF